MSKFLSGRQSNLKLGVAGYTENKTVLETTGRVGIGTTNAESFSLYVVGPTNITGVATFKSDVFVDDQLFVGGINITGGASIGEDITARHLNLSGIATVAGNTDLNGNLDVDGTTELDGLNVDGATTLDATTVDGLLDINAGGQANTFKVEDLTNNRVVLAGTGGELEDDANLTFDGATLDVGGNLDVDGTTELDGLNVDGATTLDNTTVGGTLVVNGDIDLGGSIDVDGHTELDQLRVSGVSTFAGNVDISSNGNLTVAGNLIVQGTETRLNTTALEVEDINIGIASATPKLSNAALDGAGITIYGSAGDKTLTWSNANSRMEFNTDVNVANLRLDDNQKATFGDNDDFQIFHNGSSSRLIDFSGLLVYRSQSHKFRNQAGTEELATFTENGAVELYYDNSKKFETTGIGVSIYDDLNVGTGVTVYGNAGIVSAISFFGDGSNLTNTGATLSATSGVERLVTTQLTSGTMVDAATDADLTFNAGTNTLKTQNIHISGGISTNGTAYGQTDQLLKSTGTGWEWATVPGIFSVNNILNGFNVLEEGGQVGTAGSIHTLDFRGINVTATADPQPNGIATITFSSTPTFTDLTVLNNTTIPNVIGITTFSNNVHVGSGITMYAATGIVSATKLYGDGSDLTGINAGAILGASSGTQRLVMTSLTSGAMLNAATDADLTFNATNNLLSVPNFEINGGTVSAGGTTGTNGQYLESTGVGVTWKSFPSLRTTHTENANAGITTFNFTYNVNFLDVFVNGVKLTPTEYTASNGSTVTLATPTFQDDIVELVSYNTVSSYAGAGSSTGISDGDKGDIIVSGSGTNWQIDADTIGPTELIDTGVSAGTYNFATITVGTDGRIQSASTGTPAAETFTSVGIQSAGTLVGTAKTINFANNLTATVTDGVAQVISLGGGGSSVSISTVAPGSPLSGDLWWRSTDGRAFIYYPDGSSNQWVEFSHGGGTIGINTAGTSSFNILSANTYLGITTSMISDYGNGISVSGGTNVEISSNAPSSPSEGDLWWDSDVGKGYIYYVDGNSNQWVEFNPAGSSSGGGGGGSYGNADVDSHLNVSGASSGQILSWNGSDYAWVADQTGGGGGSIAGINTTGTSYFNHIIASGTITADTFTANTFSGITTSMISDYGNGLSGGGGGGGGGISLTDLSVTTAGTPLQLGALAYNNSNGVFTFTPPDIEGQSRQALSVGTPNNPLQVGAISYNNGTGVLTYTPPDLSNYLQVNGDGSQLTGVGSTDLVTTWTLGANGSNHYTFTGPGVAPATDDPTIYLVRGQTYKFENRSGGHPFRIQYEYQNTGGTAYNDGIVNNSAGNGTDLYWEVRNDAPDLLHYQCTAHQNMSGRIVILGDIKTEGSWTATSNTLTNIDTITGISNNAIKTAEYTIHIQHSTGMQSQKVLVMQDGSAAYSQEYAIMNTTSNPLVSIGASVHSGNLYLNATAATGVNGITTYTFTRQTIR